jgi:hypothetical protein
MIHEAAGLPLLCTCACIRSRTSDEAAQETRDNSFSLVVRDAGTTTYKLQCRQGLYYIVCTV